MDRKGQGALEYLLLIGGAVLVAVVVIVLLTQLSGQGDTQARQDTRHAFCIGKGSTACAAAEIDSAWTTSDCYLVGAAPNQTCDACIAAGVGTGTGYDGTTQASCDT